MPSPIVALDLIKSSMRLVGIISGNQTPKANESNDALVVLNDLLEEWSTEDLTVWGSVNFSTVFVPNKASYTIGPTGDFNDIRPIDIQSFYVTLNGVSYPGTTIGQDRYNQIPVKATPGIPRELQYISNYPLGLVNFYPVPDQAYGLLLVYDQLLNQIPSLSSILTYPPGYAKALRWNLAVDLAAEYGVPVAPEVGRIAVSSLASIKSANNISPDTASFDPVLTGRRIQDGWQGGD